MPQSCASHSGSERAWTGEAFRELKKRGVESNYEPYPEVHRELKWLVQFLVQNNVAFQLKGIHYKALLKDKN